MTDPAPGFATVSGIAEQVGAAQEDVRAAVLALPHTAENVASVQIFSVVGFDSEELLLRWSEQADCDPTHRTRLVLAGFDAALIHRPFIDQCQPTYLVKLDAETLAVITDDGAYKGNDPHNPAPKPFRPVVEIAWLARWLAEQLPALDLQPGGPPGFNG